jgi:hypothetical protein
LHSFRFWHFPALIRFSSRLSCLPSCTQSPFFALVAIRPSLSSQLFSRATPTDKEHIPAHSIFPQHPHHLYPAPLPLPLDPKQPPHLLREHPLRQQPAL